MTDQTPDAAWEVLARAMHDAIAMRDANRSGRGIAFDLRPARDIHAAAVSRARDAEWREAVEVVRDSHDPNNCSQCDKGAPCPEVAVNATLDALLIRMDTATIKQEPTDV